MDDSGFRTYGKLPPDAALSLLGNDVRAAILLTFSQARDGRGPPSILSFSELQDRVDVEVESSRFNYHLQRLVGTYIERVEPETDDNAQPVSAMANVDKTGFRLR
ncbi:MAG TPA: hypothetical protein VE134_08540, partial [Methanomicrobiales archaeon]|nr:hypothetical protein [Methanomicrobiales archaeon]